MICSYCHSSSNHTDSHGHCPRCGAGTWTEEPTPQVEDLTNRIRALRANPSHDGAVTRDVGQAIYDAQTPMVSGVEWRTSFVDMEAVVPHFAKQPHVEPTTDPVTTRQKILRWLGIE